MDENGRPCTVVLHDDRVSLQNVLCGRDILGLGDLAYLKCANTKELLIKPSGLAQNVDEISLHVTLAERYGFAHRTPGVVRLVEDAAAATATHVELLFRDQHLSRADMWQLIGNANCTVLYRGQFLEHLGTMTAEVQQIYRAGKEVDSAYLVHPSTKPIFRSGSARYTFLIEVSQELVETWSDGDLMYERLTDGFLTDLFTRWRDLRVRHQISIVLFGRSAAVTNTSTEQQDDVTRSHDFFHIIASEASSDSWPALLRKIKQHINEHYIPRQLALSAHSNLLEAINLAAMDFADGQTDAQLTSTGTSIIAVTAGTGLFEADHALLKHTTELLVGNSIGVDIVALSPKPLHPVPLFRYSYRGVTEYALPHWVDISFWRSPHETSGTSWTLEDLDGPSRRINLPLLREDNSSETIDELMDFFDSQTFSMCAASAQAWPSILDETQTQEQGSSLRTIKDHKLTQKALEQIDSVQPQQWKPARTVRSGSGSSHNTAFRDSLKRPKKQALPPHPLMQSSRKISLGPKGLAPTRGAASTLVTTEHAQQGKEAAAAFSQAAPAEPSGIAKQIRASLARKQSSASLTFNRTSDSEVGPTSRPIDIQSGIDNTVQQESDLASVVEEGINRTTLEATRDHGESLSKTLTPGHNMLSTVKEAPNEALDMLSPWVVLLNPCNPRRDNMRIASQYRKWQHIFPRAISSGSFKWSSMCSPAALPLTSEYRPSASELDRHYTKTIRRHVTSAKVTGGTARTGLERLIDERLCQGFQIVSIADSGSEDTYQREDRPILLALGKAYHELQRFSDVEVQVVQYQPDLQRNGHDYEIDRYISNYKPAMRMTTGAALSAEVSYNPLSPTFEWTTLDEHILGAIPLPETSASCKISLVLIPVELSKQEQDASTHLKELTDDERRIDGIQRLTQMWQRQRHFNSEDQQHQASLAKQRSNLEFDRDPNPLAIEYETRDPSVVVNQRGPSLSDHLEDGEVLIPLFAESEKHHSSKFDVAKLVKQMQEPPPRGVDMRDRRWLAITHVKCFRGDDLTTWLLGAFKDLQLRGDAVAVGNELMNRGIFTHVRQKHNFRDGNYFYQITSSHRTTMYPDTTSLFSKAPWRSIPSTPISEFITSPMSRPVSTESTSSSKSTPTVGPSDKKELLLSQVLQYNVDPYNKSNHPQIVNLHYDRIHNPENCYHIYLEWLGASAKLVHIAINRWASLVETHGLRLVQIPSYEAINVREHHPFDQPEPIRLTLKPPDKVLVTPQLEPHSFSPRATEGFSYHKALLRKAGFALDYEAANSFSPKLNVRYSWGRPSYAHTQFLHKTGLVLVQIIGDENADFLVLPNRLAPKRPPSLNAARAGDVETAETIIRKLKDLCQNADELRKMYREASERRQMPPPSPSVNATLGADFDIPPIQLPPHLMHRTQLRHLG